MLEAKAGGAAMIPPLAGTYLFFELIHVVVTTPICWIAGAVLVAIFLARLCLAAGQSGLDSRRAEPGQLPIGQQ